MKLICGDKLTEKQIEQVKIAFVERPTVENLSRFGFEFTPDDRPQTDDEWLYTHRFYITEKGKLSNGRNTAHYE